MSRSGIMHHADRLRALRHHGFDGIQRKVRVLRIGVSKHQTGPVKVERRSRRNEGETRHDDFITRLQVEEQGHHFQCRRARVGQETFKAEFRFEEGMNLLCEMAISRRPIGIHGLLELTERPFTVVGQIEFQFPVQCPSILQGKLT